MNVSQRKVNAIKKNVVRSTGEPGEHFIHHCVCDSCGHHVMYGINDLSMGEFGCQYVFCPHCGAKVFDENVDQYRVTSDNLEWPTHFACTNDDRSGVETIKIPGTTITQWCRQCGKSAKEFWDKNPNKDSAACPAVSRTVSGDTAIIALYDGVETTIYVAKNFWEVTYDN